MWVKKGEAILQGKKMVVGSAVFIGFLLIAFYFSYRASSVPEVFSTPYRTAIEQEFRFKYEEAGLPIPSETFWTAEIGGLAPCDVLEQKQKRLFQEFKLLQKEARQLGGEVEELPLETATWQEVSEVMATNRQFIKDEWTHTLSESDIFAYYQRNIHQFSEQESIKGKLSFWQNGVENWTKEVELSAENIRMVTEQYPELDLVLSNIEVGESKSWKKDGGMYQFLCIDKKAGRPLPFQDVIEAVASQLVEEKLNDWLEEKLGGEKR